MTEEEYQEFRSTCREVGKLIEPMTAEVLWAYTRTIDPYGNDPMFSEEGREYGEYDTVGRAYFARSPGGEWICFEDLPEVTRSALWEKHRKELAFPAGLGL